MQCCEDTYQQADAPCTQHGVRQPFLFGQKRDGGQGDGHLKDCRGLRPTVMVLQLIVAFLYRTLSNYVHQHGLGIVLFAPLPVKLWEGKMREPDILFMCREHADRRHDNFWDGADLVMEVISPNDPNRDKITKRQEYARAGIPEYWLVDPTEQTVTVFALTNPIDEYAESGLFTMGGRADSATLTGFSVEIDELFAVNRRE